jgi:hypothetical protein
VLVGANGIRPPDFRIDRDTIPHPPFINILVNGDEFWTRRANAIRPYQGFRNIDKTSVVWDYRNIDKMSVAWVAVWTDSIVSEITPSGPITKVTRFE